MPIRPMSDLDPVRWIHQAVKEPPGKALVGHCVPAVFETYCKVLHPIFEDLSIVDREMSWDDEERQAQKARPRVPDPIAAAVQDVLRDSVLTSAAPPGPFPSRRISWRQLADRYGLICNPEISSWSFTERFRGRSWPRYLVAPREGSLDRDTCRRLVVHLAPFTTQQEECFFFYDLIATARYAPVLYRGAARRGDRDLPQPRGQRKPDLLVA